LYVAQLETKDKFNLNAFLSAVFSDFRVRMLALNSVQGALILTVSVV